MYGKLLPVSTPFAYRELTDFEGVAVMKLTKRTVEAIQIDPAREVVVWDSQLKGFGVRVKPTGRRSYVIQYRNAQGRSRRLTVGQHGRITADGARREAMLLLADVERGDDPAKERRATRKAPTLDELAERYIQEHAIPKKKPSSVSNDRLLFRLHVLPVLGRHKVAEIVRADVEALHRRIGTSKKTTANRVVALLSKAFNLAEVWGWRPDGTNPCRHVQRFKERKVERYLSREELARLASTLSEAEHQRTEMPSVISALRLLIFTGCRRGEILGLRWEHLDLERRLLLLPDSKTGQKTILLNEPAMEVLRGIERQPDNPHVIVGKFPGTHLENLKDPWGRIRKAAGIEDVRIHDLRHTFASFGVAAGFSLPILGKSLGHQQAATTQRYAHLGEDPVRQLVESVGAELAEATQPQRH